MIDRDYIIQRLASGSMTPDQFNYESLWAPPIASMFTPDDIKNLHYVATTNLYSSNLREKYRIIDEIMANRGFEKYIAGTNRVSYIPTFSKEFIVKIPYATVAMEDNIREYQNQFLIKPFCTKVFEVTPCGTIGIFERVRAITHTDEYISIADDIFELLNALIGEYVIDDIGTNYFMNIGVRRGFGPVLIDFPYIYKVDPTKTACWAKDAKNPTGYCNGDITYDPGFNYLYCPKCGTKYKPHEIGLRPKYEVKKITMKGDTNMKITLNGGSKGFKNEEVLRGDFRNPVKAIKSNYMNKKVEKQAKKEEEEIARKTVNGAQAPKEDKLEPMFEEKPEVKEEDKVVVEEEVKAEEEPAKEEEEKKPESPKEVINPFSINEDLIGSKEDPGYTEEDEDPIKKISTEDLLTELLNRYDDVEDKKEFANLVAFFLTCIAQDYSDLATEMFIEAMKKEEEEHEVDFKNFDKLDDELPIVAKSEIFKKLLASIAYKFGIKFYDISMEGDNVVLSITPSIVFNEEEDFSDNTIVIEKDLSSIPALNSHIDAVIDKVKKEYEETVKEVEDTNDVVFADSDSLEYYRIEQVNQKDLFPDLEDNTIIVLKDNEGHLAINKANNVVAAAKFGNHNVADTVIVPKAWYDQAREIIDQKTAPTGSIPENTSSISEDTEETEE